MTHTTLVHKPPPHGTHSIAVGCNCLRCRDFISMISNNKKHNNSIY